jgi:hypothetical protein
MQLFDTEEKDKKRQVPLPYSMKAVALTQLKNEQSLATLSKTFEKSSKTRIVG